MDDPFDHRQQQLLRCGQQTSANLRRQPRICSVLHRRLLSPLGSGVLLGRPILRPAWSRRYLLKFEFQHAVGHALVPSLSPQTAPSCVLVPLAIVGLAGTTVIEVTVALVTVTVVEP